MKMVFSLLNWVRQFAALAEPKRSLYVLHWLLQRGTDVTYSRYTYKLKRRTHMRAPNSKGGYAK